MLLLLPFYPAGYPSSVMRPQAQRDLPPTGHCSDLGRPPYLAYPSFNEGISFVFQLCKPHQGQSATRCRFTPVAVCAYVLLYLCVCVCVCVCMCVCTGVSARERQGERQIERDRRRGRECAHRWVAESSDDGEKDPVSAREKREYAIGGVCVYV